ncbi:MAG TPA: response regulator [Anaerolineaceae bacterium]|nr:response regulator [Anaerolineaceae bacterium]
MSTQLAILHVEDNQDNRILIRRLLQSDGYEVLEADSATQAMDMIQVHSPDLILMDINMPDIDGYTLTTRLKGLPETSRIPIIALTANVMKGDRERTLQAGCDGYIEKPIDVDNFLDVISRYVKR